MLTTPNIEFSIAEYLCAVFLVIIVPSFKFNIPELPIALLLPSAILPSSDLGTRGGLIVQKKQSETYMEVPRNSRQLRRSWARSSARNLRTYTK